MVALFAGTSTDPSAPSTFVFLWWRKARLSELFLFNTTLELRGSRRLTRKPENRKSGSLLPQPVKLPTNKRMLRHGKPTR